MTRFHENNRLPECDDTFFESFSQEMFTDPLVNLYKSSQSAAALIRCNFFKAELSLPAPLIKKGLVPDDKEDCLSFMKLLCDAKRGFVLSLKSGEAEKDEEPDLLKDTALDFADDNPYVAYPWNDLFAYRSVIGVLNYLRENGIVNFRTLKPVDSLDLGDRIEERKSFWYKYSPEFVWDLLDRTIYVTNELLKYPKTPEYSENDAFLIGHFLSASAQVAGEVVQSKH